MASKATNKVISHPVTMEFQSFRELLCADQDLNFSSKLKTELFFLLIVK